MTNIASRVRAVAAAAAVGLASLAAPFAATPAHAADGCKLSISPVPGYAQYQVTVGCGNLGTVVSYKVYGQDYFVDDYQFTINGAIGTVPKTWCNEDIGDEDELFAKVTYRTNSGSIVQTNTPVIVGYY